MNPKVKKVLSILGNFVTVSLIVGLVVLVFLIGGISSVSYLVNSSSGNVGQSKIYKNYVEKNFIDQIIADQETYDRKQTKTVESLVRTNGRLVKGRFVVIPINGAIDGESYQDIYDQLYVAVRFNSDLRAIIFIVDSPGGSVTASDVLYEEIRKIRSRGIKTVAFVNSVSASGAYYITANSDKIVASPTSIVGSIGVIMQLYNLEGLAGKVGVRSETIKSSEMKDIGSLFRKMSDRERDVLQKLVNPSFTRFKKIVKEGRHLEDEDVKKVATGEVWTAQDAKALGLVDEVAYLPMAIDVAKEITGVDVASVVVYQKENNLFDWLGSQSPITKIAIDLDDKLSPNNLVGPKLLYQWIP